MFKDPYSTTAGSIYPMAAIVSEIEKNSTMYHGADAQVRPLAQNWHNTCFLLTPGLAHIAPFAHVLGLPDGKYIVDVRGYTRLDSVKDVKISAVSDYNSAVLRLALQAAWAAEASGPQLLLNAGSIQVTVFARWLTQLLVRNFMLEPQVQMKATVICAYYYLCLFQESAFDESVKLKLAQVIARSTHVNAADCHSIIEPIPQLYKLADLIGALQEFGDSIRYQELTAPVLMQLTGGSWVGAHSREILNVALEHPPTFNAVLYTCLTEHGYKQFTIGRIAFESDRSDAGRAYTNGIRALIDPIMKDSK